MSQDRSVTIRSVADAREISRNGNEIYCTAHATLGDGRGTTLYLRSREEEDSLSVAWRETPFL